ncbi:MAG TPA: polyprenyl synthetase family protein [Bryobacteraceae bacterium]|nr:polyprenyl synthetase family protein [Bryobacteraceae bacterium]
MPQCSEGGAEALNESIAQALFPGGKRMRPLITLLAAGLISGNVERAMPASAALEFLHASSLILDDLPCMDDAQTRRNTPAVHVRFGEATAILAALALLNRAYELMLGHPPLMKAACDAIGINGMIGGQAADLTGGPASLRNRKTLGLMRLTFTAGPLVCGATGEQIEALSRCGSYVGSAFQILDDLRDRLASGGKTSGQDARHGRVNNLGDLGREGCRQSIAVFLDCANRELQSHFEPGEARDRVAAAIAAVFRKAMP